MGHIIRAVRAENTTGQLAPIQFDDDLPRIDERRGTAIGAGGGDVIRAAAVRDGHRVAGEIRARKMIISRYLVRHAGDPTVHVAVVAVGDNRNSNAESAVRSQELNPKPAFPPSEMNDP